MILTTLLGNKYVLTALAIVSALSGLWGYGKLQHSKGYSLAVSERHTADLESFKAESERLQGLSVSLEAQLAAIRDAKPKTLERYENVRNKTPLPSICIIDSDRMRELNTAIQTANSGKSGESMPASK